jgi:hypothetical protein
MTIAGEDDKDKLELSLSENAMDSLDHGLEHLGVGAQRDLKNAVLHVAHAAELFLKARLVAEHPTLIFEEPSKTGVDDRTVDAKTCMRRLRAAGVNLKSNLEGDLKSLREFRNRIEHHRIAVEKKLVTDAMGRGLRFLEEFLKEELGVELNKELSKKYYATLLDAIKSFEEKLKRVEELIQEYAPREKDDMPLQRYDCPYCGTYAVLVPDPRSEDEDRATCFFCAEECEVFTCERCQEPMLEDHVICDGCAGFIDSQ